MLNGSLKHWVYFGSSMLTPDDIKYNNWNQKWRKSSINETWLEGFMIGKLSAILQEEFANVKSCSKKKSALQSKSTEYHKAVKKFKVFYKS